MNTFLIIIHFTDCEEIFGGQNENIKSVPPNKVYMEYIGHAPASHSTLSVNTEESV